jgi:hypothetical protein
MTGELRGIPRRRFLGLALAATPLPAALTECGPPTAGRSPPESPGLPDWMMTPGGTADADLMRDMQVIHDLLVSHRDITRTVEHYSYGIRATTTSARADVAERIQAHVAQMKSRLERGTPIRQLDPLFAEIFKQHRQIDLQVEQLPNGVRVMEISSDPRTVMLIRQHALRAVSEFVAGGMNRATHPTPLPPGYPT